MVDKEVILPFLLLQNAVELDQHSRVDLICSIGSSRFCE